MTNDDATPDAYDTIDVDRLVLFGFSKELYKVLKRVEKLKRENARLREQLAESGFTATEPTKSEAIDQLFQELAKVTKDATERSKGVNLISAERLRQIEEEGWDATHDDGRTCEGLARAAVCYALPSYARRPTLAPVPHDWPFETKWWKPTPHDRVRELTKAGALIAAELDRIIRVKCKSETETSKPDESQCDDSYSEFLEHMAFLESAGQGCIGGSVADWPQLKPACKWAAETIERLEDENETLLSQLKAIREHYEAGVRPHPPKPVDTKDDLVKRLRDEASSWNPFCRTDEINSSCHLLHEAADEIERLQAKDKRQYDVIALQQKLEIERLQFQLDAIRELYKRGRTRYGYYRFSSGQCEWLRKLTELIEGKKDIVSQKGGEEIKS